MDDRGDEVNRWMAQASEGHLLQVKTFLSFFFFFNLFCHSYRSTGRETATTHDNPSGRARLLKREKEV